MHMERKKINRELYSIIDDVDIIMLLNRCKANHGRKINVYFVYKIDLMSIFYNGSINIERCLLIMLKVILST